VIDDAIALTDARRALRADASSLSGDRNGFDADAFLVSVDVFFFNHDTDSIECERL